MVLIAHRGNLQGRIPELENHPDYIDAAIKKNYGVEVDLRYENDKIYLGHDAPQYETKIAFLLERAHRLWIHCKDRQAFDIMLKYGLNCFFHTNDDYTLTSFGYVWAYPGKLATNYRCVMVLPEIFWSVDEIKTFRPYGICSDIVDLLKE